MNKQARAMVVKASAYAAEQEGGLDVCINKCPSKKNITLRWWSGKKDNKDVPVTGMRCCSQCHPAYLNKEQTKAAADIGITSTDKHGWWGEKGCRLPRTHRPTMCLLFTCHTMEKEAPKATAILHFMRRVENNPHPDEPLKD